MLTTETVLVGTAPTISVVWSDQNGEPIAAPSTPTVEVHSSQGGDVASGTATADGDQYTFTLPTVASTDILAAVWTADGQTRTTSVEVAGGVYFTVDQARQTDKSLTDTTRYSAARIIERRRITEHEIEAAAGVAFVPRFAIVETRGTGTETVMLPLYYVRSVRWAMAIATDGSSTMLTVAQVSGTGKITFTTTVDATARVVVGVEHGHDRPPAGMAEQAIVLMRARLAQVNSAIPSRAERYQSDGNGATYILAQPGRKKFGIPDLDALIARHGVQIEGIA